MRFSGILCLAVKRGLVAYLSLIPPYLVLVGLWQPLDPFSSSLGTTFSGLGMVKDIALLGIVAVWVLSAVSRVDTLRIPHLLWVLIFLWLGFIQAIRSDDIIIGLWSFRSVIEFSLVYFIIADILRSSEDRLVLLRFLLIGSIPVLLFGLVSMVGRQVGIAANLYPGGSDIHFVGRLSAFGTNWSAGLYSTYCALVMLVSTGVILYRCSRLRGVAMIALITVLPNLVLTFERRGWIAVGVGLTVFFLFGRKKRYLFWILVLSALCLFVLSLIYGQLWLWIQVKIATGLSLRPQIWESYWQRAIESLLLGDGMGAAGNATLAFSTSYEFTPHNYYLLLLVQGGLPFLLVFVIMLSRFLWQGASRVLSGGEKQNELVILVGVSCLAAIAVTGFVTDALEVFPVNVYFWVFAALCVGPRSAGRKITPSLVPEWANSGVRFGQPTRLQTGVRTEGGRAFGLQKLGE